MRRSIPRLAALLALTAACANAALAGGATLPSIYVEYDDSCSFAMRADGGLSLTSTTAPGTTIPPGTYQVVLRVPQDAPSCPLRFQLEGPGVQLDWDFGGEALGAQATETLAPSSTYVATDLRNPARYRAVFSTAASGSSSTLVGQAGSTAGGKGQSSGDLVGSAILRYRGVLAVTLGPSGAVRLAAKGKAVRSLKAGRYDLALDDRTAHGGLTVHKPNRSVLTLTGGAFVGKRTTRVALRPGTWRFSSGRSAAQLVVVAT
jgi:hypothetical protein